MKTKTMKILVTIATILLIISLGTNVGFAIISPTEVLPTDPTGTEIKDLGGKILGIVQTVGVVLSVVILSILGIKYMMGSAEEKAEYKKTFIPYIVGAVLVFLAPTIANMVYTLLK